MRRTLAYAAMTHDEVQHSIWTFYEVVRNEGFMSKAQVTRRQKDISRVLREKKQIRPDGVKKITKK